MDIPILYSYAHSKLKEKHKTNFTDKKGLKETLSRIIIRNGGYPRFIIKYTIEDMIQMNLIKRLNSNLYEIMKHNCEKRVKIINSSYF